MQADVALRGEPADPTIGEAAFAGGDAAFSGAMLQFAPFETRPLIAVAVSGGPDSLALLLLIDGWARRRGGSVLALTIDHGLRPDSAAEARQVAVWATARGIVHETLRWVGEKPRTGIQAAARAARYRILTEACAARGILHLAVAHHADDQAETVLLRSRRASGPTGLAGMAAARSLGVVRLIRPVLGWPKTSLIATCRQFGQPFFEDPSNLSDRFARTALRRHLSRDPCERAGLLERARAAGADRSEQERSLGRLLGRLVEIRPDGLATIDRFGFAAAAPIQRRAVLSAALRTIGGQRYAPAAAAVERLDEALRSGAFKRATQAGCSVWVRRDRILIAREHARAEPPLAVTGGGWRRWDGRFIARLSHGAGLAPLSIGALGAAGFSALRGAYGRDMTVLAGASLPALSSGDRLLAVPALGWAENHVTSAELRYLPLWPLSAETFTVVYPEADIMSF